MRCVWDSLWIDEDAVCLSCHTCLYIYNERLIREFSFEFRQKSFSSLGIGPQFLGILYVSDHLRPWTETMTDFA